MEIEQVYEKGLSIINLIIGLYIYLWDLLCCFIKICCSISELYFDPIFPESFLDHIFIGPII
jgi:hypothetical protein